MYEKQVVSAVIAAAGSGSRMGSAVPKQFLELGGMPVLARTALAFQRAARVDEIIITVNEVHIERCKAILERYRLSKTAAIVPGGATRFASVYNGLRRARGDIVLVHDGARPFVSDELIAEVIAGAVSFGCCVPGVVPKDTVKLCADDGRAEATPERARLRLIQTPQGFRRDILTRAYEEAGGFEGTDDSSLVERAGREVMLIPGSYDNIKITTSDDLAFGEFLCGRKAREYFEGDE